MVLPPDFSVLFHCPILALFRVQNQLMTLSARASTFGGIGRPICLAAFRIYYEFKLRRLLRVGWKTNSKAQIARRETFFSPSTAAW
jgi:hypothetical protein